MNKSVLTIVLCLCALMGVQAQAIKNGSIWWDGLVLYTATTDAYGDVRMNGVDLNGQTYKFQLSKVQNKTGEYCLAADAPDAVLPVRGELGWRVQYVRQEGMYFLAIRKPNGDAIWKLTLTPDVTVEGNLASDEWGGQQPVSWMLQNCMLSAVYLGRFSKDELRIMRNEILARHGWRFQSHDLQEYFGSQSWYQPGNNNNDVRLSVIEQLNIQLIKSEESTPEERRIHSLSAEDFPGGLADDGREPGEVDGDEIYTVTNESEFIAALGNQRTVVVGENVHLNLSRILENEQAFRNIPGRRWASDASAIISKEPLVVSESETDGRQLALVNFKELIIKGAHNASIEVDPRYAYCLYFINCEHCEVLNLTIGHTEGGYCSGGVIGVRGGRQNVVKDCDLYGCGTYGLDLIETTDFGMLDTKVHDCTYGIMQLNSCMAVRFTDCDFFSNREFGLIEGRGCEGVSFMGCRFYANWSDAPLFNLDNTFYMAGCRVCHPTENLGTIDMADQSGEENFFSEDPLDSSIQSREIGPK